jgi:hypothetical protein
MEVAAKAGGKRPPQSPEDEHSARIHRKTETIRISLPIIQRQRASGQPVTREVLSLGVPADG